MTSTTPAPAPLPTTIPVPPGCPADSRTWLQSCLALGGRHRREAESVLDVLDGRALALTPEARDWLEGLALLTTLTGGHARGLLLTCAR